MKMSTQYAIAVVAALAMTGCNGAREKNSASATPAPAPTAPAEAVDTSAMVGDAPAAATPAAAEGEGEKTPAAGSKNVLNLNLPTITKGANWKFGVKQPDPFPGKFDTTKDYFATLHTTKGDITVKFFPELAPKHVTGFIYLSEIGYYDDAPFHRVCRDFMMQGGDPSGQGTGGPGYRVPAEFNARKHRKGILSAARTSDPNSAGSQFFLMFTDAPFLDNQYTVYGEVVEGLSVVDKFHNEVAVPQSVPGCKPRSLETIKNVTVFTKDKK